MIIFFYDNFWGNYMWMTCHVIRDHVNVCLTTIIIDLTNVLLSFWKLIDLLIHIINDTIIIYAVHLLVRLIIAGKRL